MSMVGKIGGVIGRRRDSRLRVGVPAQIITLHSQFTASLADLSQSGAHVRTAGKLTRGEELVITWLGFEAFGTVVWAALGEAGLEFDEPLPVPILLQTREQVDLGLAPSAERAAYEGARSWYMGYR